MSRAAPEWTPDVTAAVDQMAAEAAGELGRHADGFLLNSQARGENQALADTTALLLHQFPTREAMAALLGVAIMHLSRTRPVITHGGAG